MISCYNERGENFSLKGEKDFHSFPVAFPVSLAIFPRKLGTAVKIQEVTTGGAAQPGTTDGKRAERGELQAGERAVTSLLFWGFSKPRRHGTDGRAKLLLRDLAIRVWRLRSSFNSLGISQRHSHIMEIQ